MKVTSNIDSLRVIEKSDRKENPELKKVSKQFESVFINQIVQAMRKTVVKGGLVPESNAERIYQNLLDAEYAQNMSESEQIGISNLVYEHLLRSQGIR
jgi:peptidoglycan hydrolase FlgJ